MFKVDWNQVLDIETLDDEQMKQFNRRNKFHSLPQNKWFKPQYLFYPEERLIQLELKQIFNVFDYNHSKRQEIAENVHDFQTFWFRS